MGLPTSGKTFLSLELTKILNAYWLNNDNVRKDTGDWDFSLEGRLRQAKRMSILSNERKKTGKIVVADLFVLLERQEKYLILIILFG